MSNGGARRGEVGDWIAVSRHPDNPHFKLDKYAPRKGTAYHRLIMKCTVHGSACQKKRNLNKCDKFGRVEPLAYCLAWLDAGSDVSMEDHTSRRFNVDPEDVERWALMLGHSMDADLAA